ncbi:MAG: hypothetical protein Ct9H300mP1_17590 [Planctomycetaceae bacterium]|nr:MAG: hypothetical protein Ct9H300mP1_17590 [Planctomycetaceae bacterium]
MSTSSPSSPDERAPPPGLGSRCIWGIVFLVMVALASSSAYLTRHCLAVAKRRSRGIESQQRKWDTFSACSPWAT